MAGVARVPTAIALGSNLGDRRKFLQRAIDGLRPFLTDLVVSSPYETMPVGVGEQPTFLNAAVAGQTDFTAPALLQVLLDLERQLGRERPYPGAPRTVDLDLILYGNAVIEDPVLIVPHPRFRERRFVLEPLAEIVPDWVDPVTGRTVRQLFEDLQSAI